jgi:hypothetical protein
MEQYHHIVNGLCVPCTLGLRGVLLQDTAGRQPGLLPLRHLFNSMPCSETPSLCGRGVPKVLDKQRVLPKKEMRSLPADLIFASWLARAGHSSGSAISLTGYRAKSLYSEGDQHEEKIRIGRVRCSHEQYPRK